MQEGLDLKSLNRQHVSDRAANAAPHPVSGLTQAQLRAAIDRADRYATSFVAKTSAPHMIDLDHIKSWCAEGAYVAWCNYRRERGAAWDTHLTQMLRFYALKGIRELKAQSERSAAGEHPVRLDHGCMMRHNNLPINPNFVPVKSAADCNRLQDRYSNEDRADYRPDRDDQREEARALLALLDPEERAVLAHKHFAGRSMKEIGALLGKTEDQVWYVEKGARRKLREHALAQ